MTKLLQSRSSNGVSKKVVNEGWKDVLLEYIEAPESNPSVVDFNSEIVVVKDKFPKALHHFLVIPRERLELVLLDSSHLSLLRRMASSANRITDKYPESKFAMGFHSIPSLNQLHLHVISQDFVSTSLKIKKHFLSFSTSFFLLIEDVIDQLERDGKVSIDRRNCEELLKGDLICKHCSLTFSNMPKLKAHLGSL